jgi:ubiquinol-cytochrome c reductase cytochrome c subunit
MLALALNLLLAAATVPPGAGAQLYTVHCASCHGMEKQGTANGPSLRGVGLASVDFYLNTGRMPAAVPYLEIGDRTERSGQRLRLEEIRALEVELAPVVAGGPPIPEVVVDGNVDRGHTIFELNCQQCHGAQARGGSLGGLDWAPDLTRTSIDVVADAIRVGPGEMPRFGERQLSQTELNDVATFVMWLQANLEPAAPPYRSAGPVPEGAVGYLALIALVGLVFTFWRGDAAPREREEAVRRDEGEHQR